MSQLSAIREAVAQTIRDADWSRGFTVYAYEPAQPSYPCVIVSLRADDPINWYGTYGGSTRLGEVNLNARILIPLGDRETAYRALDEVLSQGSAEGSSFVDTFHADPTLGGAVENCVALGVTNIGEVVSGGQDAQVVLVGADVPLTIKTRRS